MLAAVGVLILLYGRVPLELPDITSLGLDLGSEISLLRLFSIVLSVAAAAATIFLRRDLLAILALGSSGLSVAVLMILEPAPDVALVQVIVDLLLVVILILTLTRLPRAQRERAWELTYQQSRPGLARDALLAIGGGILIASITLIAMTSRSRLSQVTPYYEQNAKPLAGATDIVGAIVIDFRGLDTLLEISVFTIAGLGVLMLIRYASRYAGDRGDQSPTPTGKELPTRGIGGRRASPMIQMTAQLSLPISMMIAATHIMYGHDQPGDGFTAGVIVGLAISFWYIVFGYHEAQQRLRWSRPIPLIGLGLLFGIVNALVPMLLGKEIFSHVDYGKLLNLPTPHGFSLSTALFFELAICLSVLGGVMAVLNALGHPTDQEQEETYPSLEA